jgi:hypothetical protein
LTQPMLKTPSLCLSPQGERERLNMAQCVQPRPFSQPYPLADMATPQSKLAKASLRGEGQDEGVLENAHTRAYYGCKL